MYNIPPGRSPGLMRSRPRRGAPPPPPQPPPPQRPTSGNGRLVRIMEADYLARTARLRQIKSRPPRGSAAAIAQAELALQRDYQVIKRLNPRTSVPPPYTHNRNRVAQNLMIRGKRLRGHHANANSSTYASKQRPLLG